MANNIKYELCDEEELLQKIKDEVEVLESIYSDQEIILKAPEIVKNEQANADFDKFQQGNGNEF